MEITSFKPITKTRFNVFIDEEAKFVLYKKDIDKYDLKIGDLICQDLYDEIIEKKVYVYAKDRALNILKYSDRSEFELRDRLKKGGFSHEIVDRTLKFIYKYNYIDDERFTKNYIGLRKFTKSKRKISQELYLKGINKELANRILEEEFDPDVQEEDPEVVAIEKAVKKKKRNSEKFSPENKEKLITSLYRKGFNLHKILEILKDQ